MSIISNTTVLSNFASIGQLDVLRRLYQILHIPTEVYEEISAGLAEHRHWTLLTDDNAAREEANRRRIRLSGSIRCLVLAVDRELITLEQSNEYLSEMIRLGYRSPLTDITPLVKRS